MEQRVELCNCRCGPVTADGREYLSNVLQGECTRWEPTGVPDEVAGDVGREYLCNTLQGECTRWETHCSAG